MTILKVITFLPLFSVFWLLNLGKGDPIGTVYKGNILYVRQSPTAITVNPKLVNFHRGYNMDMMLTCLETLDNFAAAYHGFCEQTMTASRNQFKTVSINSATNLEAAFKCQEFNGKLPEITNPVEANMLLADLRTNNRSKTLAGLRIMENQIVYHSNQLPNEYNMYQNCQGCNITNEYDTATIKQKIAKYGPHIYFLYEDIEGRLIITAWANQPNAWPLLPITCVLNNKISDSVLKTIAKHSCRRDREEIKRTNAFLRQELFQFMKEYKKPKNSRPKRGIGLALGAGYMGIEAINSLATGSAPFSFLGKGIASVLGIATAEDLKLTRAQLEKHSKALTDLAFNQQQIIEAHNMVTAEITELYKFRQQQTQDIAVLYADLDNKVAIYNLQTLLQLTLLKMSNAVTSAQQHNTSPYVFGQTDLDNIALEFGRQGIQLTNNLNEVYTSVALIDGFYTFIFSAPIVNGKNDFYFYELRDLPIYHKSQTYKLRISHRYFAINSAGNEYIMVTETEFRTCLTWMVCNVAAPFMKITPDAPCEILTLKYSTQHCQMDLTTEPSPNFITLDNVTFYSVPNKTEIHIACTESQISFDEHKQIMGTGQIQAMPGCEIQVGTDTSVRPGFVASRQAIQGDALFKILNVPDMPMLYPTEAPILTTSQFPIAFRDVSNIQEAAGLIFNQDTVFAEAIRIIIYITIAFSILASIYCCCPSFRLWLNGCCFIQKPTKYWRDVKGYKVPDFISKHRQNMAPSEDPENQDPEKVDDNIETIHMMQPETTTNPRDTNDPIVRRFTPYPFRRLHRLYNPSLFRP